MNVNETYADYLLNEKDLVGKIDIVERTKKILNDKKGIAFYFNNSAILKAETTRMFMKYASLKNELSPSTVLDSNVDANVLLTSCLICNCKKKDGAQSIEDLHTYATMGAELIESLGFDQRFCKICRQFNRYNGEVPREPEADVLELVDKFGGMILDRPEREGFSPKQAVKKLEENFSNKDNAYLNVFKKFVIDVDEISIDNGETPVFMGLKNMCENDDTSKIINGILYKFEEKTDKSFYNRFIIEKEKTEEASIKDNLKKIDTVNTDTSNRKLFSSNAEEEIRNLQMRLGENKKVKIER